MHPYHHYVDIPHAEENTYDMHEHNVPIDPQFDTDLEEHNNDINQFLALLEVTPARKRNRQQPLLDFLKSKILTSLAYTQACKELLVQRTSRESEAKRKQAKKEANHESRLREKEEQQRQVHERAQVREANRHEPERCEAEKRVAGTRRRRQGSGSESVEAATSPQLQPTPTPVPQLSSVAIANGGHHPPPTAPTNAHNTGRGRSRCLQRDTPISVLVGRKQFNESNATDLEFSILLQSSSSSSSISIWISKSEYE